MIIKVSAISKVFYMQEKSVAYCVVPFSPLVFPHACYVQIKDRVDFVLKMTKFNLLGQFRFHLLKARDPNCPQSLVFQEKKVSNWMNVHMNHKLSSTREIFD